MMTEGLKGASRHLVDPGLLALLEALPDMRTSAATLDAVRARKIPQPPLDADAAAVRRLEEVVPGLPGMPDVRVIAYLPAHPVGLIPAALHLHGGGFVAGTLDWQEARHRHMVATLDCAVIAVDYRLAPEAPYPAALNDSEAALRWAIACGDRLAIDPGRLGVMGESAGGGLAASLALRLRDAGDRSLAFQHLVYPMLDDRTGSTRAASPFAGEFLWTAADNRYGWSALLGRDAGGDDVPQQAVPARARSLEGLPPTFLMTGALDLFADENIDFARRLLHAGVPTEFHVFPGAFHGFDLAPEADLAVRARSTSAGALVRLMAIAR